MKEESHLTHPYIFSLLKKLKTDAREDLEVIVSFTFLVEDRGSSRRLKSGYIVVDIEKCSDGTGLSHMEQSCPTLVLGKQCSSTTLGSTFLYVSH